MLFRNDFVNQIENKPESDRKKKTETNDPKNKKNIIILTKILFMHYHLRLTFVNFFQF